MKIAVPMFFSLIRSFQQTLALRYSPFSFGLAIALAGSLAFLPRFAVAAELDEIQKRGYLIVAVKETVNPLGYRDASGTLQGFEIEIAHRLAEELLGRREAIRFVPVSNRDRLSAVLTDQVDLAIAQMTVTASRMRLVSFSRPYYIDGTALITANPSFQRLADARQATVAILEGSSAIAAVQYFLPRAQLVGVTSYAEARSLLETGAVEAFAGDASVLSGWARENPGYRLLPPLLSGEPLSVVMPKGVQYDPLRREVNAAIARWAEEGWLKQEAAQWGLPDGVGWK